jgi:putative N6-adenine-specific DNA methylase
MTNEKSAAAGTFRMTAKTFFGLEGVLSHEIRALGGSAITAHRRAVSFTGDTAMLYRANLHLRTAIRILKPISTFEAADERALYDGVRRIDWSAYLNADHTLAVDAALASDVFRHSKYVALKTKDAIVDQFRDRIGRRPSVDVDHPSVRINVYIYNTSVTVGIDSSGESLHKRGWRTALADAQLNEILAAGLVLISGWDGRGTLFDPLCGSGTILIEAALMAGHIAPGLFRQNFGFMTWRDFDRRLFSAVRDEAKSMVSRPSCRIIGSDILDRAVDAARRNIKSAGLQDVIELTRAKFEDLPAPDARGILITNPPYGERIGADDLKQLYRSLGGMLKHVYAGWEAWVLIAKNEMAQHIGLRPSRKFEVFNGDIECRFQQFKMYRGSREKAPGNESR